MKKLLGVLVFGLAGLVQAKDTVITIAASPVPQAEILKQVKPILKSKGIDLEIKEFSDYVQPNLLVEQNQLDANFFQHKPYMEQFNKEHGTHLVSLVAVHIEPMGVYASSNSKLADFIKTKNVTKLPKGISIGVPNDTTNEGRALLLLQQNKIITVKPGVAYPTKRDIIANPYNITIKELDPGMLARNLVAKQLDLAIINSNYAIQSGLNPMKDAIFVEGNKSPYVNIIAVRPDELKEPQMQALAKAIKDKAVTDFILKNYKGAVVPVN